MEFKMVCKDCGKSAEVDKEKSTDDWKVYVTECDKCKGQVVPKVI